ncbi:MAG: alcohol dehydrogenase catalytic domain-containing protein [Christensenella sp.]|uniref:alcohol dehydrogenase catalytic domain-containing protein n=1 Tax=Christensenella sp. TaxID=1935934 RepID=UPI002B1F16C6|nr:alcohol dehydrogenase catalytic domain-containing protein [Christensenella sp.]MEA5001919.1 alcohol dehydrogenase catalytic domain-containing protein [Christensenella sp.]
MKAVVKYQQGKDGIELRDVPVPEIGDDDVLLEIKAAGLCGSDLAFAQGHHADILFPPVILGHEFSGVVAKVGKNVTRWKIGDRVVSDNTGKVCGECYACSTADYLSCPERLGLGYGLDGGFAKYCKIYGETLKRFPNSLMRLPECISFEEAAVLDPACNAYMAVVQEAKVMPGEYVAVFGVGALGQFSIQAARAAGAAKIIVIGLSQDAERFELAKQHGATDIVTSDKVDAVAEVKRITNGEGVSTVVDCAGVAVVLKQAIEMVRTAGVIIKIGYDEKPLGFSLDDIVGRAIQLKGHFGYDWISWRNVMNLVVAGKFTLNTAITHKLKISQFEQALGLLRSKEAIKVILYPED